MKRKIMTVIAAGALSAAAIGGGIAVAGGEDDAEGPDTPITGEALERASAAAIEHLGGGTVTETEVGDEESFYEVEVILDGREYDVQLDEDFNVVGSEAEEDDDEDEDDDVQDDD